MRTSDVEAEHLKYPMRCERVLIAKWQPTGFGAVYRVRNCKVLPCVSFLRQSRHNCTEPRSSQPSFYLGSETGEMSTSCIPCVEVTSFLQYHTLLITRTQRGKQDAFPTSAIIFCALLARLGLSRNIRFGEGYSE